MTAVGLASYRPAGQAAIAAVTVERSIGRPVFLRLVNDVESADDVFQDVAGGIDLADRCLGPAESVYATARRDSDGAIVYLAVTARCPEGGVAQIGTGVAPGRRSAPGLLLIGDQGTLEGNPAAGGVIYEDDRPGVPLRDETAATRRVWERGASDSEAMLVRERRRAAVLAAIHRSLDSGRLEPVESAS